ncbi:MAG: nitrate transporter permease [Rhodospirillales bacterium]|jgi:NitT/TauT family transport system permease protein|nr:nitrate transporter permease [Rhodospirillales bacterium]
MTSLRQHLQRRRLADFFILLLALVVVWQIASWLVGDEIVVSPAETIAQIGVLYRRPTFWGHFDATLLAFAYAASITIVLGLGLGISLGISRAAYDTCEPLLMALASLPKVTLYPVILMFFGVGFSAKVVFGVLHGVVPITLFTMNAVRNMPAIYARVARLHRLSARDRVLHMLIPAVLPEIFSGLRLGLSVTLLGVVLGEMFASTRGLGSMLMGAIGLADFRTVAAVTFMLIVLATLLSSVMLWLDRRLHHGAK